MVKGPQIQGALGGRVSPLSWEPLLSPEVKNPSKGRKPLKQISHTNADCWGGGAFKERCPTLKGKGLFQEGMLEQPSGTEKAFSK